MANATPAILLTKAKKYETKINTVEKKNVRGDKVKIESINTVLREAPKEKQKGK